VAFQLPVATEKRFAALAVEAPRSRPRSDSLRERLLKKLKRSERRRDHGSRTTDL
jgi:hypothetical protein